MALNINGTTGISGVDGSASNPSIQGTDGNTGVAFGADILDLVTGGNTRFKVGAAGQLGVAGANYGTSGQALLSQGASAAPQWGDLAAGGKILQVKTTTKSNTFETNSSSYVDIPDLNVSITPASASNKILFISSVNFGANQTGQHNFYIVLRDSTQITSTAQSIRSSDTAVIQSYSTIILDSPNSTSALTYKIQCKPENSNSAVGVNRNIGNTLYGQSTILCMEVSA